MKDSSTARISIFLLLSIIGIILIFYGIDKGNTGSYAILSALGAAILGATIPIIISSMIRDDFTKVKDYLLNENGIVSKIEEIDNSDGQWFLYHTSVKDGNTRWLYSSFELKYDKGIGTLKGHCNIILEDGKHKKYMIHAAARSDRLIFIESPEKGSEPHSISTIHGGTTDHLDVRCGVTLHQTWGASTAISPCMLTRNREHIEDVPLDTNNSNFFDLSANDYLYSVWKSETSNQKIDILLPINIEDQSINTHNKPHKV